MKIAIIGHVCIDHNISESSTYTAAGSPAVFINKIMQQFDDCETMIIAPYGKDFLPHAQKITLYPSQPISDQTLVYENIIRKLERDQKVLYANNALPIEIENKFAEIIKQADIIFIAPILPNFPVSYIQTISSLAKKGALKIMLPQGYFREIDEENEVVVREFSEADKLMPCVNITVISDQDHPYAKEIAREWARKSNTAVIVTLAEKGALIITKNKQTIIPTMPVPLEKIVDSIGAGDIFSAAFSHNYVRTRSLEKAVKFANEIARQCLFQTTDSLKI
ncbi:hypothetical protein KAR26_04215 [Candidatus Parcubacteria bacterium]|nr:hypothetical protein [Candidatus Parcubacteria bacterium]